MKRKCVVCNKKQKTGKESAEDHGIVMMVVIAQQELTTEQNAASLIQRAEN